MFRRIAVLLTCCLSGLCGRAATSSPQLLQNAVQQWLGERDHWAFTQRAVEYVDGVPHERVESYDPSRRPDIRWLLMSVDGRRPTPEERQKWMEKKFHHKHRKIDTQLSDFFDFDAAKVVSETPGVVRFEVPLRHDKNWLFPVDKVQVDVTVNKQTQALEHLTAHVREPFRVLLGVARVWGGDADLDFLHFDATAPGPANTRPAGEARVSVTKLGERVDFTWTDFKRVTPFRGAALTQKKGDEAVADE